jgi:hypothetical protein
MLSSGEPSRRRDSEGNKNALEANRLAMSSPEAGKINVGHDSPAGSAFLPRRLEGSRLLNISELRCLRWSLQSVIIIIIASAVAACGSVSGPSPVLGTVVVSGDVVQGTGTVSYYTFEGGFYAIRGDDASTYDPINLPDEFKVDGLRVRFEGRLLRDRVNFHMAGPIIEVVTITRLR